MFQGLARMSGIALWIPGPWKDRSEFVKAIASTDCGVIAAGGMMVEGAHQRHAMFEILEPDGNLAREMLIGSGRSLDGATLEAIEGHNSIAALLLPDTGEALAETLGVFARAVRTAGGLAVKVHFSGLSHGWDRWESELSADQPAGLFRLLVVQVPDFEAGVVSSFGMKQFSLPDARSRTTGKGSTRPGCCLSSTSICGRSGRPYRTATRSRAPLRAPRGID
jgi:hypothetical protein